MTVEHEEWRQAAETHCSVVPGASGWVIVDLQEEERGWESIVMVLLAAVRPAVVCMVAASALKAAVV
jgi:hypothetical protein